MLEFHDNPCSDVWLNSEKSAEVIVPERPGRTEHEAVKPPKILDRTKIVENQS